MRGINQFLLAALCTAGFTLAAADLAVAKLEDYTGGVSQGFTPTENGFIFKSPKRGTTIVSKAALPIDMNKTYRFSGSVRRLDGCERCGNVFIGIDCLDKNGKSIGIIPCYGVPNTQTVLAKAVKAGDTEIFLKDASKWQLKNAFAAFNVKEDWSDIPNRDLSPAVKSIGKAGDLWKISLKKPMTGTYPEGTSVRCHRAGAAYIYLFGGVPKTQATAFKRDFKGTFQTHAIKNKGKFRPATEKIRLMIICSGKTGFHVEFKDLAVEEVK